MGCKVAYNTLGDLDEHNKEKHNVNVEVYICEECDSSFSAKFKLRQHVAIKHKKQNQRLSFNCNKCGELVTGIEDMNNHVEQCMEEFMPAQKNKVCRYFARWTTKKTKQYNNKKGGVDVRTKIKTNC